MKASWKAATTVVFSALALLFVAACGSQPESSGQHTVSVFAAASLQPAGEELAQAFTQVHPDATVEYNFAGSSDLALQIEQGAPADMFISANQKNMDKALAGQDFAGQQPELLATNTLVLALPKGNPGNINSLQDLPGKRVAICAPEVPCGTIAGQVLKQHNITLDSPSEEANVAAVSTKVAAGEVDAGSMYSTDAQAQADKGVTAIDINGVEPNEYPIALTSTGADNAAAVAFQKFLLSQRAQDILASYGFTPGEIGR